MTSFAWRDTAQTPRLFFLDARCLAPLVLFLFHITMWTLYVALGAVIFFSAMEWHGISPEIFLRMARVSIIGRIRPVSDRFTFRKRFYW